MKTQKWILWLAVALLSLAVCEGKAAGPLSSVSAANRTNFAASGSSFNPAFSVDGRFVVFLSHANNLVTNDDLAPYLDVFVRELATSNTVLVSVNRTGVGGGNGNSSFPSISSNGQFVAFASTADNLVDNDTNGASDGFVRDLVSGVATLVSVDTTGTSSAGNLSPWTNFRLSNNPLISANGRWIIFESLATNLVALNDTNQMTDIFARDLQSNTTFLLSINAAGTGSGNGNSESPNMTPDGRFVAFVSTSTDLVPGATNQLGDIYVRDLQSGATLWASQNVVGFFTNNYRCFNPVISADGRFVAFKANNPANVASVLLIRQDLQTGVSTVLTSNATIGSWPEMSADGRLIASESSTNIFGWDLQTGSNVLVSINSSGTGPANQACLNPVMSPDGGSVAFLSAATNLAANATNGVSQVYVRNLVAGTTRLVSANVDNLGSSSAIDVTVPAVSPDGRFVLFESTGADLVANDLNQASDVFLRDLNAATTQLISQRHPTLLAGTATAPSTAAPKSISAHGRYVVFSSFDNGFALNDTNGFPDIFARDLSRGALLPVSVDNSDAFATNQTAYEPVISADGRYVAFGKRLPCFSCNNNNNEDIFRRDLQSGTTAMVNIRVNTTDTCSAPAISSDGNLVAFATASVFGGGDIFARDMTSGSNKLVSINRAGTAGGSALSFGPLFSPDDRWIVFASGASDLTTNSTGGLTNLFARDLVSSATRLISVGPDGASPLGYIRGAVFSANSRYAAFVSSSNSVVAYDFVNKTSAVVCVGCDAPSISADGWLVAYETPSPGTSIRDIVVKDLQTGLTNLVSMNRTGTGGGNGSSTSPLFSWDGRFIVFASKASDLVDNDTNGATDIFVRDLFLGTTLLASLNQQGNGAGNSVSSKPILAADGRTVVFQSFASDLVPGDYNDRRDVFVLHLGGPDTDKDGMDDDWEMAYFGTLARDGTGDFDGDGRTDLQEFLAGTDPTNSGSVLRALTVSPMAGGSTRVIWSASPGKRYLVQFKDSLSDSAWTSLPGVTVASGTTGSMMDNAAGVGDRRFYRVILAP